MQSFDINDKLIKSKSIENLEEAFGDAMKDPNVKHVTVGKLPHKGDEVKVNGLRCKVVKWIRKERQLILELL